MVLPRLVNILPWLTPLAGAALFVLVAGAVYTHVRLKETPRAVPRDRPSRRVFGRRGWPLLVLPSLSSRRVRGGCRFYLQPNDH